MSSGRQEGRRRQEGRGRVALIAVGSVIFAAIALLAWRAFDDRDGTPRPIALAQFAETEIQVGDTELRVLVADTEERRVQGLQDVEDLGAIDGMIFVFDGPTSTSFTMANTRIPLSIGFYDERGRVVDRLEMTPCDGPLRACPGYDARAPYVTALETPRGRLPEGDLVVLPSTGT